MKMLLFKPELGTLKLFNYPEDGRIVELVEDTYFDTCRIIIDDVSYKFFVGGTSTLKPNNLCSFYKMSTDHCLYGNIVIGLYGPLPYEEKDITAEDILRIKSHIVVRNKGYMINLD